MDSKFNIFRYIFNAFDLVYSIYVLGVIQMTFQEKIKQNWKQYSTYSIIAVLFLLIGMSLTEIDALKQILVNVLSGLITQSPWFILIFIGITIISKSIRESGRNIIQNVPIWIEDYYKKRMHLLKVETAVSRK